MALDGIKKKLYRLTYDKPVINKKALQFEHSMDELKKLLGQPKQKKNK